MDKMVLAKTQEGVGELRVVKCVRRNPVLHQRRSITKCLGLSLIRLLQI